ncbi:phage tail protein [Roseospira navarrensis]|uniref:Phage tail fibre protein N-terminal domain-containing protein n=1 Tax=Roseospira navarrensis TaxID=140058 RepID=A0A7X2D3Y0_9PROT|nr:phage tail protein [Roseospira navarrensis]MQX37869.1 hypothetical protein [Roseospira navarrensis]
MSEDFRVYQTDTGRAKIANALVYGQPVEITHMAVGDGGGADIVPDTAMTALVRETYRSAIETLEVDANNPAWVTIQMVIPSTVGGWYVREVGLFDAAGDLIAIARYPSSYKPVVEEGAAKDMTIKLVLEVSNSAAITLIADTSVIVATRPWVLSQLPGPATTEVRGIVELATSAECAAGTDTERAVTPSGLSAALDARMDDLTLPVWTVSGLDLSPAAGAETVAVTISPGWCMAALGDRAPLTLETPLTKRMDAGWSAGNGAGGLDAGAVAAGTRYAVWLITDTGGALDALISTDFAAPTAPAGWTARRRVGTLVTDGAGGLRPWVQWGSRVEWEPADWDVAVSVAAGADAVADLPVPPLPGTLVAMDLDVSPDSGLHENVGVMARPNDSTTRGVTIAIDAGSSGLFGSLDGIAASGDLTLSDGTVSLSHTLATDPATVRVRCQGFTDPRDRGI